jgi:hypothetical protein
MKTEVMQKLRKLIHISILTLFLVTFAVNIQLAFGDKSGKLSFFGYEIELIQTSQAKEVSLCGEICTSKPDEICTYLVGTGYCFGYPTW